MKPLPYLLACSPACLHRPPVGTSQHGQPHRTNLPIPGAPSYLRLRLLRTTAPPTSNALLRAYEVTVDAAGFQSAIQTLNLETAQKGRADFKLGVSQLQSAVTVQAAATQLAAQDASLSSVVGNT